jgi:YtkA-like
MKRILTLVTAGLLMLTLASVASAGGWAVVTLDLMPMQVIVNQPLRVGFTIRQHGRTLWESDNVRVRGYHPTGETFTVQAPMDGRGHYTAELNFTKAGEWQWAVASGLMPEWQPMPNLNVIDPAQVETEFAAAQNSSSPTNTLNVGAMLPSLVVLGLGVLGFVGCGAGLVFWRRNLK